MQADPPESASRRTVLAGEEVHRRKAVLILLQDALAAAGVESVIVGRRVLTLYGTGPAPSRPEDPELHVLAADRSLIVTTDGRHYRFADGRVHLADDPRGAAGCVLPADARQGDIGCQASVPASHAPGRRDGTVGAGERALRNLGDGGVI